jgi:hypothetical protein
MTDYLFFIFKLCNLVNVFNIIFTDILYLKKDNSFISIVDTLLQKLVI